MTRRLIAIDGPAGAGKTTVSRALAERLKLAHLDTGATYRLVGLEALRNGTALDDEDALVVLARDVAKRCALGRSSTLEMDGAPVGEEIRTPGVADAASKVAVHAGVREVLVELQRNLVPAAGAVVEGRDIGEIVLPDADVKVYLDASPEARAQRRAGREGAPADAGALTEAQRDERDAARALAPMRPADGAVVVDTTSKTPEQVVDEVAALLEAAPVVLPIVPHDESALAMPAADRPNWAYRNLRIVLIGLFRLFFRFETENAHLIPVRGPAILAANHRSLLDIPLVALPGRRMVWFMGKKELFESRLGNWFFSLMGGFPVHRGRPDRKALNRALDLLRQGEIVGVFPEGTRTPDGSFQQIQDGLAYLALKTGAPIVPVALTGTEAVFPRDQKLPAFPKIRIKIGMPFTLGGPVEGVMPRGAVRLGTQEAQRRLREIMNELEPK